MFVFGVANALGLARIQKQLIPDKLIPFLRKRWENAKFPYNSPPQVEIFGAQFKIMRKPFKIVIFYRTFTYNRKNLPPAASSHPAGLKT